MKCILCKHETTWDDSTGPEDFIVCSTCFNALTHLIQTQEKISFCKALEKVFQWIMEPLDKHKYL